jgi:nitroreductase
MKQKNNRRVFLQKGSLLAPLFLFGKLPNVLAKDTSNPISSIFDVFKSRRSVRKYKSTPVPKEHIEQIVQAAASAPSAGNQQPWRFLVVQSQEVIQKLHMACIDRAKEYHSSKDYTPEQLEEKMVGTKEYYQNIFAAPVFIVVLTDGDSKYPDYHHWDGPLAAGYLLLAARALGYASVHFTDSISDEVTKKVLNIPDRFTRVCITPIGIPQEWPEAPSKKELKDMVSYDSL